MCNQDIRNAAKSSGVKLWQVADAIGICDTSFSKKLRKEIPQEEKSRILLLIQQLARKEA